MQFRDQSPFHSGCFGLASSELAKGAIAYRFRSEKLIRSLVKLVMTWWHNESVCYFPGSSLSQIGIAHLKYKRSRNINLHLDNHKLSDRNEGEGRFGNHTRLQHTERHLTERNKKLDPFTVQFVSDDSCIGSLIRVICRIS